jgi:hypothetical protein
MSERVKSRHAGLAPWGRHERKLRHYSAWMSRFTWLPLKREDSRWLATFFDVYRHTVCCSNPLPLFTYNLEYLASSYKPWLWLESERSLSFCMKVRTTVMPLFYFFVSMWNWVEFLAIVCKARSRRPATAAKRKTKDKADVLIWYGSWRKAQLVNSERYVQRLNK